MSFPTTQPRRLALTPPSRRTLKHHLTLGIIFVFAFATYIGHAFSGRKEHPPEIRAGKLVSGLSNKHELRPKYIGSEHLQGALENNQAEPRSLASADFDEDGVPDLVSGYATGKKGIVSLRRGNIDSIYPNTPEANQRKLTGELSGAPFLSTAHLFETPFAPDFLGAGDFNADGHWDVVLAARGIAFLSILSGDGHGNFGETKRIALPGGVTALITGEINRADGLTDVIVAINGESGSQALVFEGPSGALKANPESFSLPAPATSLALGQLSSAYTIDLAVAAGAELLVIYGRDRKLTLTTEQQSTVDPARIERRVFSGAVKSLAIGNFDDQPQSDIAALTEGGEVHLLSRLGKRRRQAKAMPVASWENRSVMSASPGAERLIVANISTLPADDLLFLDSTDRQLRVLQPARRTQTTLDTLLGRTSEQEKLSLALEGAGTIAVLPMQLDVDALTDLVVLRQNQVEPVVVLTASKSELNLGSSKSDLAKLPGVPATNAWSSDLLGRTPQQKSPTHFVSEPEPTDPPGKTGGRQKNVLRPLGGGCPSSPITIGQTVNGELVTTDCFLDDGNFVDVYSFTGTANQQISISLDSNAFDAFLYLLAPDGTLLASDDDGGSGTNAQIPTAGGFLTLPSNGTYTIYATSFEAEETGLYTLSLTAPGGGQCPATPITGGQTLNGTLATGDCTLINAGTRTGAFVDIYTFTGFQGQQAAVTLSSNNFDAYLYAFPPDDSGVLEDDDSGGGTNARIPPTGTVILPANGVYTIFATSFAQGETGNYAISLVLINPPLASTDVINTNDSGPGSLRQAIINANANQGVDTITFHIGTGAQTIVPLSPLPEITDPVVIDGTTQPGFAGTPLIELNGQSTPQGTAGLKIISGSSRVRGLVINRFGASDCNVPLNFNVDPGSAIVLASVGNNIIDGNFIGTNQTGTTALCNSGNGIFMFNSSNNTIGGTTAAARNVISGNRLPGIAIGGEFSTGNMVQGNYVGTNASGSGDLGNQSNGMIVINGTGHVIGGTVAGSGNVVSGNNSPGIALGFSDPAGILVQGNYVGTNAAGTAALPNVGDGIIVGGFFQLNGDPITATDNTIGGTTPAARNVISGNVRVPGDPNLDGGNGVEIINEGSQRNKVQGNYIGLNALGTAAIPNAGSGVFITRAPNNFIGGDVSEDLTGTTNYIAANGRYGVGVGIRRLNDENPGQFITGGDAVDIVLNVIGTDPTQTLHLGNALDGVYVDADSVDIYVNGNVIAFNGRSGVRIPDANGVLNDNDNSGRLVNIDLNYIFGNAARAVDLGFEGITPNDPGDTDGGANLQQNFPSLNSSSLSLREGPHNLDDPKSISATNVSGTLNSAPNTSYTVHWYFSNDAQCVAGQAASRPLAFGRIANVNTNAAGDAPFTIALDFPVGVSSGIINCSATDPQGNTSEFSACFSVSASGTPTTIQFSSAAATATETLNATTKVDLTVTRSGNTSAAATVNYASSNGTANDHSDYLSALGTLRFAAGETTKTISVFIVDDAFGEPAESFNVTLSNPLGGSLGTPATTTVTINSNEAANGPNPVRDATFSSDFFVRQHYVDFFNREADPAGLGFWKNQIDECTTQACREIRRINVSAAFYVSIEFQQTGYLVYKAYQAAFNSGEQLSLQNFLPDTQEIGRGVVIGQPGAEDRLEANKQAFFLDFVQRPAFLAAGAYPTTLTAAQFVDKLNANTFDPRNPGSGPSLTPSQRDALVNQLASDPTSNTLRAQVLRSVSENGTFHDRQFNKAFVLMQYFGYLRRNPNSAPDTNFDGYNFWLGKLNQFNGNFVDAEMVKAFITSGEYIARFGP